ncbi:MAG: preprotein translocase subunit Sec61beta [Candidatus Aenigmarchaeota archaeon]|nr:preprotein translocase subunit Sec61beta [Candidatus Aenigmarchaeota archaeon]
MAKKDSKVYMPAGVGGLVRYPEEEKEALKIKPQYVVFVSVAIAVFEIALHFLL